MAQTIKGKPGNFELAVCATMYLAPTLLGEHCTEMHRGKNTATKYIINIRFFLKTL